MESRTKDKHFVFGRAIKNLEIRYLFDRAMNIEEYATEQPRDTTFDHGAKHCQLKFETEAWISFWLALHTHYANRNAKNKTVTQLARPVHGEQEHTERPQAFYSGWKS